MFPSFWLLQLLLKQGVGTMNKRLLWVLLASISLGGCWVDDDDPPSSSNGNMYIDPGNPGSEPQFDKPNKYQDRDHDGGRSGRGSSR